MVSGGHPVPQQMPPRSARGSQSARGAATNHPDEASASAQELVDFNKLLMGMCYVMPPRIYGDCQPADNPLLIERRLVGETFFTDGKVFFVLFDISKQ